MTGWGDARAHFGADVRAGFRQSMQDITVAKLVVAPFALTVVLLLGWMIAMPVVVAWVLFALLMTLATAWNAGWRARTAAA